MQRGSKCVLITIVVMLGFGALFNAVPGGYKVDDPYIFLDPPTPQPLPEQNNPVALHRPDHPQGASPTAEREEVSSYYETYKKYAKCITDFDVREGQSQPQRFAEVSMRCVAAQGGDRFTGVLTKYTYLRQQLADGWAVLVVGPEVRLMIERNKVLDYVVGDSDVELKSSWCAGRTVPLKDNDTVWYNYGNHGVLDDGYNGFWDQLQKNQWTCLVPWHWNMASYDPQVFYARPTAPTRAFVDEMIARVVRSMKAPALSPLREDFTESDAFNLLTVYREDKYLIVRKFPPHYWASDLCTSLLPAGQINVPCVGRVNLPATPLETSKGFDPRYVPLREPTHIAHPPNVVVPELLPCTPQTTAQEDPLCHQLWQRYTNASGVPSVGISIIMGDFVGRENPELADIPRVSVSEHTICACLDEPGCESCRALKTVPYPLKMDLVIPGAEGKGLINLYKYFLALEVLRRGFGVLSFDVDVIILRSPWQYFTDPRFDIFISSDAHVPEWHASGHHSDAHFFKRASVNTGFWYVKPTPEGRCLFGRVTDFFRATGSKTGFFFEQAMVHTVLMQTKALGYAIAEGDVRLRMLSPYVFMNSKTMLESDGDPLLACTAVSIHANYYCPYGPVLRQSKGKWLGEVAVACKDWIGVNLL